MADETSNAKLTWPYTSFKTILNLVDKFEVAKALPPKIDRSVIGGSEGQKTQVLAALKFLAMIDEGNNVTALFQQLVNEPMKRKAVVKSLVEKHYPEALKLSAVHGTTGQLEQLFEPLTSDTRRKAITFFLNAAKFADMKLSANFKVPSGFASARNGRKKIAAGAAAALPTPPEPLKPSIDDAKARYLDMLLEKAKTSTDEKLDTSLLDRIEKLLGYPGPVK